MAPNHAIQRNDRIAINRHSGGSCRFSLRPCRITCSSLAVGRGQSNTLERPPEIKTSGWDSGKDTTITIDRPTTETDVGGTNRQPGNPPGGGGWRVMLLDSEKHNENQVVKAITRVIPNCDMTHAKNCFHTSKQLGIAIVTTCLKEHAEFYRNQLYAYGCRSSIEPDLSTA